MVSAIIALRVANNLDSIEDTIFQTSQITKLCIKQNITLVGCVATYSGVKDLLKKLKKVDRKKRFDVVIVYSPRQITKNHEEYVEFVNTLKKEYAVDVYCYRS